MPGRLLNLVRRPSPNSSTVDVSKTAAKRDSFISSSSRTSRTSSPSPVRNHNKTHRTPSIDMFGTRRQGSTQHDAPIIEPQGPAVLGLDVESPPLLLLNSPQDSSGALFSGQLKLNVTDPSITVEALTARFVSVTTHKKPVHDRCSRCATRTRDIKTWDFLAEPVRASSHLNLKRGEHKFPLSYLVDGSLPATTNGANASLEYKIIAEAVLSTGEAIPYSQSIKVSRAIVPGSEKHSIRVFPPTNLTMHVTLPPVINPIGEFNVQVRIAGTTERKDDCQLRWKLRRLNWRVEETQKTIAPACTQHRHKLTPELQAAEIPGQPHEETHDIGGAELKSGWKTDDADDSILFEFPISVNALTKPLCNMSGPDGMSVKHQLDFEMVVAQDWSPKKKPQQCTPTGAARVLRCHFGMIMTERPGMGISWDEEQPPRYEDVPSSPPHYKITTAEECTLSDLDDASSVEDLPA